MIANEYINRAIDYILNHIEEDLSVEAVSSHCNFSRFHFSRMFKAETGEGVFEFIKRVRMEQSALRLKFERDKSVTDIGGGYGYSASNYSTSFKRQFSMSPAQFRRGILQKSLANPFYGKADITLETFEECDRKIALKSLDDRRVIYRRFKESYTNLSSHWDAFLKEYKDFITDETLFIERTYNDPSITDIDGCLYDICLTAPEDCELENTYVLKGGKFACYHFEGHVSKIYAAYQSLLNVWLPRSGYEIDERYDYDVYRKIDCDTMVMTIEFCIPLISFKHKFRS